MTHPAYTTEPGPPKKYSDYQYDIETQNQEASKNNEELDKRCKKYLFNYWLVLMLLFVLIHYFT